MEEKPDLEEFRRHIESHVEHVKKVGAHCTTEEPLSDRRLSMDATSNPEHPWLRAMRPDSAR